MKIVHLNKSKKHIERLTKAQEALLWMRTSHLEKLYVKLKDRLMAVGCSKQEFITENLKRK